MANQIYFISYDLGEPNRKYDELLALIKEESAWARLGGSAYLVKSGKTAVQLRDRLKSVLDIDDKLYVGRAYAPAAWYNLSKEVSQWIKNNLEKPE